MSFVLGFFGTCYLCVHMCMYSKTSICVCIHMMHIHLCVHTHTISSISILVLMDIPAGSIVAVTLAAVTVDIQDFSGRIWSSLGRCPEK